MNSTAETTVLFVDVCGSTGLYERVGDTIAHAVIEKCVEALKDKTKVTGGQVIKTIGDEVMSVFPTVGAAVRAAVEMQECIDEMPTIGAAKIGVRTGFHYGPVVERDGDVFGDTVNLAARLAGLATKGQILTSRETVDRMTLSERATSRRLYSIQVKGRESEVDLYEILWQQSDDQTTLSSQRTLQKQKQTTLRIKYLERELVLDGTKTALTLGRDKSAGLIIVDRMASRLQGKIECRLGKFVLADHSANGTFVTLDNEPEVVLRREELVLRGRGVIAFGQPRAGATEVVEFECE